MTARLRAPPACGPEPAAPPGSGAPSAALGAYDEPDDEPDVSVTLSAAVRLRERLAAAPLHRCTAAPSGRPPGRCFMLPSRVRRHDGRVANGACALEHPSVVLGDLAICSRLRCRTGQARLPYAHVALALCLQAGHAGPAAGSTAKLRTGQARLQALSRCHSAATLANVLSMHFLRLIIVEQCYDCNTQKV